MMDRAINAWDLKVRSIAANYGTHFFHAMNLVEQREEVGESDSKGKV
jgi:hypothetical protein